MAAKTLPKTSTHGIWDEIADKNDQDGAVAAIKRSVSNKLNNANKIEHQHVRIPFRLWQQDEKSFQ